MHALAMAVCTGYPAGQRNNAAETLADLTNAKRLADPASSTVMHAVTSAMRTRYFWADWTNESNPMAHLANTREISYSACSADMHTPYDQNIPLTRFYPGGRMIVVFARIHPKVNVRIICSPLNRA
jgi:hypothetical protein